MRDDDPIEMWLGIAILAAIVAGVGAANEPVLAALAFIVAVGAAGEARATADRARHRALRRARRARSLR